MYQIVWRSMSIQNPLSRIVLADLTAKEWKTVHLYDTLSSLIICHLNIISSFTVNFRIFRVVFCIWICSESIVLVWNIFLSNKWRKGLWFRHTSLFVKLDFWSLLFRFYILIKKEEEKCKKAKVGGINLNYTSSDELGSLWR